MVMLRMLRLLGYFLISDFVIVAFLVYLLFLILLSYDRVDKIVRKCVVRKCVSSCRS